MGLQAHCARSLAQLLSCARKSTFWVCQLPQLGTTSAPSRDTRAAKLLGARAEMRMSCAFRTGKFGKNVDENVTSKWAGRNSKDGWDMRVEKARWRGTTHVQQTPFWQTLEPCVYVTRMRSVRMCADKMCTCHVQKNVRATCECMYTSPVVHTVAASCVRTPKNSVEKTLSRKNNNIHHSKTILTKKIQFVVRVRNPLKILRLQHSMSILIFLHQLAFHQSLWVEASRFPEACVSERQTFLISWFAMMPLYGPFPLVQDQKDHSSFLRIITTYNLWFWSASSIHANNGFALKHHRLRLLREFIISCIDTEDDAT